MKYKIITILVLILSAFAVGRYSVETKPSVAESTNTAKSRDTEISTTITQTELPDGKKQTVTTINKTSKTKIDQESSKIITPAPKASKLNVSALGGFRYQDRQLVWGLHVQKQLLGPITGGVWGLNNGVIGVSLGLEF